MLGKIEFVLGLQRHEAWLDDDLTWRCDDPRVGALLNEISDAAAPATAVNGAAARHLLFRVACRLGGQVRAAEPPVLQH